MSSSINVAHMLARSDIWIFRLSHTLGAHYLATKNKHQIHLRLRSARCRVPHANESILIFCGDKHMNLKPSCIYEWHMERHTDMIRRRFDHGAGVRNTCCASNSDHSHWQVCNLSTCWDNASDKFYRGIDVWIQT